jgi:serine/threonine protein kinase
MIGSSLSHYDILSELGRGGMGIVYKARDTKLERDVALKVLPAAALASQDDRARFYREAKAAAALNHPNIAAIHQIDEAVPEGSPADDARPFIAMEFIDGETLDARIKRGRSSSKSPSGSLRRPPMPTQSFTISATVQARLWSRSSTPVSLPLWINRSISPAGRCSSVSGP